MLIKILGQQYSNGFTILFGVNNAFDNRSLVQYSFS